MGMTRLLTIEEAAQHLNVSKTSLRRWTKLGTLPCVRVGARQERRFMLQDLERFLSRGGEQQPLAPVAASGPTDPLVTLIEAAKHGVPRHVSLHFDHRDELWRLFRPYVLDHLKRAAPMLYVHEENSRDDVLARLRSEGFDPDRLAEQGLLRLLVPAEAYLRTGSFAPERMIDFMEAAILDRRSAGGGRCRRSLFSDERRAAHLAARDGGPSHRGLRGFGFLGCRMARPRNLWEQLRLSPRRRHV